MEGKAPVSRPRKTWQRKDAADDVKACTRLVVEGKAPVSRPRKTWQRKDAADDVKACTRLVVEGKMSVGRLRKTWQNTLSADMRLLKVDPRGVRDRVRWRAIAWCKANPTVSGTLP